MCLDVVEIRPANRRYMWSISEWPISSDSILWHRYYNYLFSFSQTGVVEAKVVVDRFRHIDEEFVSA